MDCYSDMEAKVEKMITEHQNNEDEGIISHDSEEDEDLDMEDDPDNPERKPEEEKKPPPRIIRKHSNLCIMSMKFKLLDMVYKLHHSFENACPYWIFWFLLKIGTENCLNAPLESVQ